MSNIRSKSSAYVNSLVGFTLDTKPYHSKLTEVAIEYRFDETMNVSVVDAVASQMVKKAGWLYGFTSGGSGANRILPLQRVVSPDLLSPYAAAPNADMLGVPHVYAKKNTLGYGEVNKVGAATFDRLVRSNDYFHSYGSAELRVSLPEANDTDQSRRWQPTNAEGVMGTVTAATQQLALDVTNPSSANRRIRALLLQIQAQLAATPKPSATAALNDLLTIIDTPDLPRSYEALLNELAAAPATPVISGFTGWIGEDGQPAPGNAYVDERFSQLTPPAFFNTLSDMRLREGSSVTFPNEVAGNGFTVVNAQAVGGAVDEWLLQVVELAPLTVEVRGAVHGYIGAVTIGGAFTSPFVSFSTVLTAGVPAVGDVTAVTPISRLVVDASSPTQVWNLIKTDPLAHDRPVFTSSRYGWIEDAVGTRGQVTVLDPALPSGTIIVTFTSPTAFTVTGSSLNGTVGTTFDDGRLRFTVRAGSVQAFQAGDRFLINIVNRPAEVVELDLYFGYDLDSYDNMVSGYGPGFPPAQPFEFRYDSRFTDFDFSAFNLTIAENAVSGRRFRLTALPGAPVNTIKKDGTGPSNAIDLTEPTSGVAPDPALTSPPVLTMPGDPNPAPDLRVFLANTFRLEYSDDGFATSTVVGTVSVGSTYTNAGLGISFTLAPGSKPFIAVSSDDGVEGGDVFMWRVVNDPPTVDPSPIIFSSINSPYLLMHSSGFWSAPDAAWTIAFSSDTDYEVSALYTSGPAAGSMLPGYPASGSLLTSGTGVYQNLTYKDDLAHFTIKRGTTAFATGDEFTFRTFERKPSILVHGSVSGWQPEAVVGEWYWNGHIGFKINAPVAVVDLDPGHPDLPLIEVTRIRPDTPSLVYTFTRLASSFIVNRSDVGVVGYAALTGTFEDAYLSVELSAPADTFTIFTTADELQFWNAEDTIIVRSEVDALLPQPGDIITVQKAEEGRLGISLNYDQVVSPPVLADLYPFGINDDFVDTDTGPVSPPIEKHSPEAVIYSGWLPLMVDGMDATNSIAFFPDVATSMTVRSAATNQVIGTVRSLGTINEPITFEWNPTFFNTYLPLSTSAKVMTYGTHLDEKVKVRMHERVNFMIGGGVLLEDALFSDAVNVNLDEAAAWDILAQQVDALTASIDDTFTGFLPGYGNLPYDAEDALGLDLVSIAAAGGRYDTGSPLVDGYLRAQFLSALVVPTAEQEAELQTLLLLLQPVLQPGGLGSTTLPQVLAALDTFTPVVAPEMGLPAQGLGIDVSASSTEGATTSFSSSVSFFFAESVAALGDGGFDDAGLDAFDEATAVLLSPSGPPVPNPTPTLTTYTALETPLFTSSPARVFVVTFPVDVPTTPTFRIWSAGAPSAVLASTVVRESARSFRFSIPAAAEAKVVVT